MYLDDISLVYSNGYPGSEQYVHLPDLDRLLASVLETDQQRDEVRKSVARHVCNVYDYRGQRVAFAESHTENQFDCANPASPDAPLTGGSVGRCAIGSGRDGTGHRRRRWGLGRHHCRGCRCRCRTHAQCGSASIARI